MARRSTPLEGRVALVTGAAQGMGRAHARRLAADGATVVVNDREASSALSALAEEIGGHAVPADVSVPSAVVDLVDRCRAQVGEVDVLVANHAYMTMGDFLEHEVDDWWRVVDTNLSGTYRLIREVVPGMRRRGAGRIVVISSEWGVVGWPRATAYAASKAGLVSLVKTLGRELAPEGIIVNGIAPGVVRTPQIEVDARDAGVPLDAMLGRYAEDIPTGRVGEPEEVSATVALLADFEMSALVGQMVQVNGGSTRCRA